MEVKLPDGSPLELSDGATGADAARAIGEGLAEAALAQRQDGEVRDLAAPLEDGARLEILTSKDTDDSLWLVRHDAAHVLATAVMELYPDVKIATGPPVEDGFYYDFEFPEDVKVSDGDLEQIEARMREHVEADEPFERSDVTVEEALERFREDQDYKVELIEDLVRDEGVETVSLYRNGPFTDLCRGPHGPSTKRIDAFKLTSVAGAYWRGRADRQMLTRIYGTAFLSKDDLDTYLDRLEEARARDHRKLGRVALSVVAGKRAAALAWGGALRPASNGSRVTGATKRGGDGTAGPRLRRSRRHATDLAVPVGGSGGCGAPAHRLGTSTSWAANAATPGSAFPCFRSPPRLGPRPDSGDRARRPPSQGGARK